MGLQARCHECAWFRASVEREGGRGTSHVPTLLTVSSFWRRTTRMSRVPSPKAYLAIMVGMRRPYCCCSSWHIIHLVLLGCCLLCFSVACITQLRSAISGIETLHHEYALRLIRHALALACCFNLNGLTLSCIRERMGRNYVVPRTF